MGDTKIDGIIDKLLAARDSAPATAADPPCLPLHSSACRAWP